MPSCHRHDQTATPLFAAVAPQQPRIIQIPFSHYCHKVTWAMDAAGEPYETLDVSLPKMLRSRSFNPAEGTVPVLHTVDDDLLFGSAVILDWLNQRRPEAGLFPLAHDGIIREWQAWADEVIGPVARREAYRVAHNQPLQFGAGLFVRLALVAYKKVTLGVLKLEKARRFEEADTQAVRNICARISEALAAKGTGFLVTDHPTAADYAVAALFAPLRFAARAHHYEEVPGWADSMAFVKRVRPAKRARVARRSIRESDFAAYEALNERLGNAAGATKMVAA